MDVDVDIKKAEEKIEYLSSDPKTLELYKERERSLHERANMINGAIEEGEDRKAIEIYIAMVIAVFSFYKQRNFNNSITIFVITLILLMLLHFIYLRYKQNIKDKKFIQSGINIRIRSSEKRRNSKFY